MHILASQYVFSWGPFHPTTGEAWYAVLGILIGLVLGVHMAVPKYMKRE